MNCLTNGGLTSLLLRNNREFVVIFLFSRQNSVTLSFEYVVIVAKNMNTLKTFAVHEGKMLKVCDKFFRAAFEVFPTCNVDLILGTIFT